MSYRLLVVALLSASYCAGNIANATEQRIHGVSQFLLDRANDNYFYIFEKQLRDNGLFRCYFPNTYAYASSGHLKTLLRSSNELWDQTIEADIDGIENRLLTLLMANIDLEFDSLVDTYLQALQSLEIEIEGYRYPLDNLPIGASQVVIDGINRFYPADNELAQIRKYAASPQANESPKLDPKTACVTGTEKQAGKNATFETFYNKELDNQYELYKQLGNIVQRLGRQFLDHRKQLYVKPELAALGKGTILESLDAALQNNVGNNIRYYKSIKDATMNIKSIPISNNVLKTLEVEKLLRKGLRENVIPVTVKSELASFNRFVRYIVFFAEISEATTSEQVEQLLKEVTLPPVSFGLKRKPGENRWLITSYLGAMAGRESSPAEMDDKTVAGIFAPIGIEYTWWRSNGRSASIMFAPFDFAHPLNLEIEDKDESIELSDIVAPGLYFSYGFKDLPLTAGIGANKGRALKIERDKETRLILFISVDMPLLNLF